MNERKKMRVDIDEQEFLNEIPCRNINHGDSRVLGSLMYDAYKDTIDYENETLEEFCTEIEKTFEGQYGPCLFECSFMIELDSMPIAASIITLFKGVPLLTYTVTHPKSHNNGYSTFLIQKSMNQLLAHGYKKLYLVVTTGNNPAVHIYDKLGFVEVHGEWDDILDTNQMNS